MRSQILSLTLAVSAAKGVLAVNYDGAKAIRIPVGDDVIPLMEIIDQLQLPTWKGMTAEGVPKANSNVDLVVPADKVEEFETLIDGIDIEIMHEDLGASIAEESPVVSDLAGKQLEFTYWHERHFVDIIS